MVYIRKAEEEHRGKQDIQSKGEEFMQGFHCALITFLCAMRDLNALSASTAAAPRMNQTRLKSARVIAGCGTLSVVGLTTMA